MFKGLVAEAKGLTMRGIVLGQGYTKVKSDWRIEITEDPTDTFEVGQTVVINDLKASLSSGMVVSIKGVKQYGWTSGMYQGTIKQIK